MNANNSGQGQQPLKNVNNRNRNIECFNCGKMGHYKSDCRAPKKEFGNKGKENNNNNNSNNQKRTIAVIEEVEKEPLKGEGDIWDSDSGSEELRVLTIMERIASGEDIVNVRLNTFPCGSIMTVFDTGANICAFDANWARTNYPASIKDFKRARTVRMGDGKVKVKQFMMVAVSDGNRTVPDEKFYLLPDPPFEKIVSYRLMRKLGKKVDFAPDDTFKHLSKPGGLNASFTFWNKLQPICAQANNPKRFTLEDKDHSKACEEHVLCLFAERERMFNLGLSGKSLLNNREGVSFLGALREVKGEGTLKIGSVSGKVREGFDQLVNEYSGIFAQSQTDIGCIPGEFMGFNFKDPNRVKIIRREPYTSAIKFEEEAWRQTQAYLKAGIVEESHSDWKSSYVMVNKPQTEDEIRLGLPLEYRMAIDYSGINKQLASDAYPMHSIGDCLRRARNGKIWSCMDFRQAYNHIAIAPEERKYSAYQVKGRLYQFTRMTYGWKQAPSTWQRVMDRLFGKCDFVTTYLDDVLVSSENEEEHLEHLSTIFAIINKFKLKAKMAKCHFFKRKLEFLGFELSENGIGCTRNYISKLFQVPRPLNRKQLEMFLGMVNWIARFIPYLSDVILPLNGLRKKKVAFNWTKKCEEAFKEIKKLLGTIPVLMQPDFGKPFHVFADASDFAIGAVLLQMDSSGKFRPVEFYSKGLANAQLNWSTGEKEMFAFISAVEKWEKLLIRKHFFGYTDHKNIKFLFEKNAASESSRLFRWKLRLQQFSFTTEYVPGKINTMADYLSRRRKDNNPVRLLALRRSKRIEKQRNSEKVVFESEWSKDQKWAKEKYPFLCSEASLDKDPKEKKKGGVRIRRKLASLNWEKLAALQNKDLIWKAIKKALDEGVSSLNGSKLSNKLKVEFNNERFLCKQGVLYYMFKGLKVPCIPETVQGKLLSNVHEYLLHQGRDRMINFMRRRYYWSGMYRDIGEHCRLCENCLKVKSCRLAQAGPLQLFPSKGFNEMVHMDLVGPLPQTFNGMEYILVIIDKFSRFVKLVALPDKEAETVAIFLYNQWILELGCPDCIVSDRGTEFLNKLDKGLSNALGIERRYSAPYHPETNGSVERFNRFLKERLGQINQERMEDGGKSEFGDWDFLLPSIAFAYNIVENSATTVAPFEIVHGFSPKLIMDSKPLEEVYESSRDYDFRRCVRLLLESKDIINGKALESQEKYDRRRKKNDKRKKIVFAIGDEVTRYMGNTMTGTKKKLSANFKGNFVIVAVSNNGNSYRVRDLMGSAISWQHISNLRLIRETKEDLEEDERLQKRLDSSLSELESNSEDWRKETRLEKQRLANERRRNRRKGNKNNRRMDSSFEDSEREEWDSSEEEERNCGRRSPRLKQLNIKRKKQKRKQRKGYGIHRRRKEMFKIKSKGEEKMVIDKDISSMNDIERMRESEKRFELDESRKESKKRRLIAMRTRAMKNSRSKKLKQWSKFGFVDDGLGREV